MPSAATTCRSSKLLGAGNVSFVSGKIEQAALLDRIAYLSCPSHSALGLSSANNFTIACIASYTAANPNFNLAGKWSERFHLDLLRQLP
jgi:hypothetical protein